MRTRILIGALAAVGLLAGCVTNGANDRPEPTYETAAQSAFVKTNYAAADSLVAQFKNYAANGPLIVATVVNIDTLDHSSTLGRLVSEQVSARFAQSGYSLIEMKFRNSVYMKRNEGELMLTRELGEIAKSHNAQAVIVGTYGASSDSVFVNLKIVQPGSNAVLAAHDYVLPLNRDIRSMLGRGNAPR